MVSPGFNFISNYGGEHVDYFSLPEKAEVAFFYNYACTSNSITSFASYSSASRCTYSFNPRVVWNPLEDAFVEGANYKGYFWISVRDIQHINYMAKDYPDSVKYIAHMTSFAEQVGSSIIYGNGKTNLYIR